MLDENLIATLEQSLRLTREAQHRLMSKIREADNELGLLKQEYTALENSAAQTELAIDSLLVATRSSGRGTYQRPRSIGSSMSIEDDRDQDRFRPADDTPRRDASIAYLHHNRSVPAINRDREPISNRFSDRTITQACTLLLRETGGPLHVNDLYNLLIAGGFKFNGKNPTISIAVSLNRNKRFRKVDPGTFDLVVREARKTGS
jgi:hypothetical protein